jgi:hypothetical protein
MRLLHIQVQNQGRIFEVLPEEAEHAELAVEDVVGQILLDLCRARRRRALASVFFVKREVLCHAHTGG